LWRRLDGGKNRSVNSAGIGEPSLTNNKVEQYARLLVETCVDVRPRDQVLVSSSPLARPLVDQVARLIGERGAWALQRIVGYDTAWANAAPEELLAELPPIDRHALETCDVAITIIAPENTRELTAIPPDRQQLLRQSAAPVMPRFLSDDVRWVGCQWPTPALAQEAGMTVQQFEDFLFGAVLLDWDEERRKMERYAAAFDAACEVRILAEGTDLTLSLEGRHAKVDAGGANMPGGEFFFSPVEDSANGEIAFLEFPAHYMGHDVTGARLRFENGVVVEATATSNEEYMHSVLDTDEGARRLGELGVGCNPGIQRFMRNTLFDEKIEGTVHLALGAGFPQLGGTNVSTVHWDIVKDLRRGGRIELDGKLVQQDGRWLV
jgi:aminopeptidase